MQTPDRAWLEGGGVELWIAEPREHGVDALLGAAERARAGRFALPEARARFVTARALARWGLAHLTGLAPDALPLYELPSGKPVIGVEGPRFNVSHSGSLVVAGFAWGRDVGVDVEQLRARAELRIARRHFRDAEVAAIAAEEGEQRTRLFARCWTRKEALLKAYGASALAVGLARLERPFALDRPWEPFACEGRVWAVGDVPLPVADHVAAVAVEASELRLRVRAWQP